MVETVRIISRRPQQQKEMRDFEFPYFDEEEGRHEQSYIDYMRQQRMTFEKQMEERKVMKANAAKVGAAVFARLQQRTAAVAWARGIANEGQGSGESNSSASQNQSQVAAGSSALAELNRSDRTHIKIAVSKKAKVKKRKRSPPLSLE